VRYPQYGLLEHGDALLVKVLKCAGARVLKCTRTRAHQPDHPSHPAPANLIPVA
jgi:hypothetical protein